MLTYHFFPLNNMNAPSANIYLSRRHSPEDGDLLVSRDIAETATIRWVAQYTFTSYEQVRAEWLTFDWVREHCDYRSLYPEHSSHGSESVSFCYPWKKHGRCIREGITVGLHFSQTVMSCMAGLSLKKETNKPHRSHQQQNYHCTKSEAISSWNVILFKHKFGTSVLWYNDYKNGYALYVNLYVDFAKPIP